MHTLEGLPILDHYNNLLAKGEPQDALAILQEFFDYFPADSSREFLWFMLATALKNESDEIQPRHRGEMIFFYEYCIALFKASQVLCTCRQQGAKTQEIKEKSKTNRRGADSQTLP
jgi:hypothetical protein